MSSLINPQLQSKFFTAPAEIRFAIYAYLVPETVHLFLSERGLRLSLCVQRDQDDHPDCANRMPNSEKLNIDYPHVGPIYVARLRSTWGEHWRCEEASAQIQYDKNFDKCADPLLLVCKQMYDTNKPPIILY
jgi:hypothetical protein